MPPLTEELVPKPCSFLHCPLSCMERHHSDYLGGDVYSIEEEAKFHKVQVNNPRSQSQEV